MGLKLLHTADWHLGSSFAGFPEPLQNRLKEIQRSIPEKISQLCRRENCRMMLLAGDIFDGRPSADTVELVKNALKDCGVPVLVSPGNHDFCCADSPWVREIWPENVHIFRGGISGIAFPQLDCRVYGAGYQSMDCPGLLEGFRAEGPERYRIGLFHGDPVQSGSPYCHITGSQVKNSGLDYLALGHIHKAGAFRSGDTLCAWPGCPMGRGWDETGAKGICTVTLEDTASVQALMLDTPRFHSLRADIGTDALSALEQLLPAGESQDFFRVTLTGSGTLSTEDLTPVFRRFPNLQLVDRTEAPRDLFESADEDSLEGIFFRILRNAMEEDPQNAQHIRLAAEIAGKILSGKEVVL